MRAGSAGGDTEFGIALTTTTESWKLVKQAEALGFHYAWFYDTQLLNPDIFVGMALAARERSAPASPAGARWASGRYR